jgi:hypothetical protein
MNVDTLTVSKDTAVRKIADIKGLKRSQRTEEDDALLSLYTSVAKHGARVITLSAAFRQAGLNEKGKPRLAIAAGHWPKVFFRREFAANGGGKFRQKQAGWWNRGNHTPGASLQEILIPAGTFENVGRVHDTLATQVPYVPAEVRPKFHLRNYHILFEVEKWTVEMPVDPFLLKHIMGETYAVLAEWELTPLEASLLGSMRSGN